MLSTQTIREKFLTYFQSKGHTIVSSSSLVPTNDPTLLFTNAGMVPFKDVFLGREQRSYRRATTVQKCMRAGGKHNDLEQVGYTARHHTFFEMLGNFSFGDYFKREAIQFAWEFLTGVLQLPKERLWITVFEKDDEAAVIWLDEMKIDSKRFSRCGEKDNFWAMGDTGPCGPCSEIFYDHGPSIAGGPPGSKEAEGDRYVEIWNLVFMQFNRDVSGTLTPLPKPSVDTGMGLERIAAVMQGVHSNYDIDIFKVLIQAIRHLTGSKKMLDHHALCAIADHIRASAFLIVDGVLPSNEGRGYVLRRIIRRAIRHGNQLGLTESFFYRLVEPLITTMGEAYPALMASKVMIENALLQEEQQFAKTLQQGLQLMETFMAQAKIKTILGEIAFKLYDTYGFPLDLTEMIAKEKGFSVDRAGFDAAMEKQRAMSRQSSKFQAANEAAFKTDLQSDFVGYDQLQHKAIILGVFKNNALVSTLQEGESGQVILNQTPFYAESGGQVADRGFLVLDNNVFQVEDVQKIGHAIVHYGKMIAGEIIDRQEVKAEVDALYRQAVKLNHSAAHLLQSALRAVLGSHVVQKGSSVDENRLRFDFLHFQPVSKAELAQVEQLVNQQIRDNYLIETTITTYDQAVAKGAMALFNEKYGDQVRMVCLGDFSSELCGGTHAARTGDIGLFQIIEEAGIAAGVRRIEAVTGVKALDYIETRKHFLDQLAQKLKTSIAKLPERVDQLLEQQKAQATLLQAYEHRFAEQKQQTLIHLAETINDIDVVISELKDIEPKLMREMVESLKSRFNRAVILLALVHEGSVHLVAGVTKNCVDCIQAGELIKRASEALGGKGGGRPDFAQGGGKQIDQLPTMLETIKNWTKQKILVK